MGRVARTHARTARTLPFALSFSLSLSLSLALSLARILAFAFTSAERFVESRALPFKNSDKLVASPSIVSLFSSTFPCTPMGACTYSCPTRLTILPFLRASAERLSRHLQAALKSSKFLSYPTFLSISTNIAYFLEYYDGKQFHVLKNLIVITFKLVDHPVVNLFPINY